MIVLSENQFSATSTTLSLPREQEFSWTEPLSAVVFVANTFRLADIVMTIERSEVLVSEQRTGVCGTGRSQQEAIDDLYSNLTQMLKYLRESKENLSQSLTERLEYLSFLLGT